MTPDEIRTIIREELRRAIPDVITPSEAARILGVSTRTVARKEKAGELRRINRTGKPRYSRDEIFLLTRIS